MYKKILLLILLFVMTSFSTTVLTHAQKKLVRSDETLYYFTTVLTFSIWHTDEVPQEHWDEIEQEMIHIENTFSRTNRESELYKLNQNAGIQPVKVSEDLYTVIKKAVEFAELTNGKFEPTIGPLLELWGEIDTEVEIPTEQEIEAIKPLIDYKLIEFNDDQQSIYLPKKGMIIDLGAISKGYAADKAAELIKAQGYEHALVNLGGNMITIGPRHSTNDEGNNHWIIGLKNPKYDWLMNPTESKTYGEVSVTNKTVVSSGTYERYWIDINTGEKYHHILDPSTGYPVVNNIEMVSIITENSTAADAMSTSVLALGIEEGMKAIEELDGVEAIFVTFDRNLYVSSGMGTANKLKITDSSFTFPEIIEDDKDIIIEDKDEDDDLSTETIVKMIFGGITLVTLTGAVTLIIKNKTI